VDGLRRWLGIPDGRGPTALRLVLLIFTLGLALVVAKAAQSGLFLSAYERDAIPWAFAVSALVLATSSSLAVSLAPRLGPARLATASVIGAALLFLGLRAAYWFYPETVIAEGAGRWLPFATYVFIEAASGVLLIQIWSVATAATDARTARRLLPVAGMGAGAAWTLGGFAVAPLSHAVGAPELLTFAAVALTGTGVVLRLIVRADLDPDARAGRKRLDLLQSWREGFGYVLGDPLMRLVALLATLMLCTEQLMDFHLMATAQSELGTGPAGKEHISAFFGRYYGATSAIGLLLLSGPAGRVLERLGTTRSLLLAPGAVALAALGAAAVPGLLTAVFLRGTGRILKQSVWAPSSEQLQTPLSNVRRSQAKSAIRGVLAPAAYAVAALGLAAWPDGLATRWAAALACGTAGAMAWLVARRVRATYTDALHAAVDARRLILGGTAIPGSARLDDDARRALGEELAGDDPARAVLAAEMLAMSEKPESELLLGGLAHTHDEVRDECWRGLEGAPLDEPQRARLAAAFGAEPSDPVRRTALATLARQGCEEALAGVAPDSSLGARAAIALAERRHEGEALGAALLPHLEARDSLGPALAALTPEAVEARGILGRLERWLGSDDADAQLLAARAVVRLGLLPLLPEVVLLLKRPRTAPAAARCLVAIETGATEAEPEGLGASISRLASRIARAHAPPVVQALVLQLLRHPDQAIRREARHALGESIALGDRAPLTPAEVQPLTEAELRRAYRLFSVLGGLAHDDGVPDWEVEGELAFLAHEVDLQVERARADVLATLVLRGREKLVTAVEVGRRQRSPRRDAHVAELLALGLEADLADRVVPLFERISLRERVAAARRLGYLDDEALADPRVAIVDMGDDHLRRCARVAYGARLDVEGPDDEHMVSLYERIRFLRSVPVFHELDGDDVLQLAQRVEQEEPTAGTLVFAQGDPGADLYLVVRGAVAIRDGERTLATMESTDFFGELALLDHQARSADAVVTEDAVLLRLRAADFEELMERRPRAMRAIVRVLARRLRSGRERAAER